MERLSAPVRVSAANAGRRSARSFKAKKVQAAADIYNDVVERFPTSRAAPEAAYFAAVVNYRNSKDSAELMKGWEKLRIRYPESDWRLKQSMVEDVE